MNISANSTAYLRNYNFTITYYMTLHPDLVSLVRQLEFDFTLQVVQTVIKYDNTAPFFENELLKEFSVNLNYRATYPLPDIIDT